MKFDNNAKDINKIEMKKISFMVAILVSMQTIFSLGAYAQFTKLLDFAGSTNGANPYSSLISDGTFLYGTTEKGGAHNGGTIFKIMPNGNGYVKLHDFTGGSFDGHTPRGSLFYDGTFLWGMTSGGGAHGSGIIFNIRPDGSGYQDVFDFLGVTSGSSPEGSFISDGSYLLGMTTSGGTNNCGTIFKIMLNGTGYAKIFDFQATTSGCRPYGSLLMDGTYLYGLTSSGGTNDLGTLFKIMPNGNGYLKLLDFKSTINGGSPHGSLISDGNFLYGMTPVGGANGNGTIFKLRPNGNDYETLLDFDGVNNGEAPQGSLISKGGYLYGMTLIGGVNGIGTVFRIDPDGNGYLKLLDFEGASNGRDPRGSLFADGTFLYGMTWSGGTNNYGVIFRNGIVTGMYENNQDLITTISPNPAMDFVTVNIAGDINDIMTLNIFDVMGKRISSKVLQLKQRQIYVGDLNSGIYLIEIISSKYKYTGKQKLIIQR